MDKIKPKFNKKLPKGYKEYFNSRSDKEFKKKHKKAYTFFKLLGVAALGVPMFGYVLAGAFMGKDMDRPLAILGLLGAFIFGIGIFNIVAAFVEQYLGHKVTVVCMCFGLIISIVVLMNL